MNNIQANGKKYTNPVICQHNNDLKKDWYVFFEYTHDGRKYKIKKREGINRIKTLPNRIREIKILRQNIEGYLDLGWNPIIDNNRKVIIAEILDKYYFANTSNKRHTKKAVNTAFEKYYYKH
jgi:hypothetical protein